MLLGDENLDQAGTPLAADASIRPVRVTRENREKRGTAIYLPASACGRVRKAREAPHQFVVRHVCRDLALAAVTLQNRRARPRWSREATVCIRTMLNVLDHDRMLCHSMRS